MNETVHDTWKETKHIYNERANQKPKRIEPVDSKIIKDFQMYAIKVYGETIMSKVYTPEEIINEFKRFNLNVHVRCFTTAFKDPSEDTHYVVELLPNNWEGEGVNETRTLTN